MAARRATYGTRPDFREGMELRPREARIGELSAFDGSAWLTCGGTSVVVGVSGPVAPPRPTLERPDEAVVTVALQRSQGVPSAGAASKLLADRRKEQRAAHDTALTECVRQAMSAVILLREYPRSVFAFAIHVLSDDGSLLSVALNAAMVALMDAGVSCRTTVAAASIALAAPSGNGNDAASDLLVDPSADEEETCRAVATFAHVLPANGGGMVASRIAHRSGAPLTEADIDRLEDTAKEVAQSVFDFYRECLAPQRDLGATVDGAAAPEDEELVVV
jgi:ribonuclease PH